MKKLITVKIFEMDQPTNTRCSCASATVFSRGVCNWAAFDFIPPLPLIFFLETLFVYKICIKAGQVLHKRHYQIPSDILGKKMLLLKMYQFLCPCWPLEQVLKAMAMIQSRMAHWICFPAQVSTKLIPGPFTAVAINTSFSRDINPLLPVKENLGKVWRAVRCLISKPKE